METKKPTNKVAKTQNEMDEALDEDGVVAYVMDTKKVAEKAAENKEKEKRQAEIVKTFYGVNEARQEFANLFSGMSATKGKRAHLNSYTPLPVLQKIVADTLKGTEFHVEERPFGMVACHKKHGLLREVSFVEQVDRAMRDDQNTRIHAAQQIGVVSTYFRRYALAILTGIILTDEGQDLDDIDWSPAEEADGPPDAGPQPIAGAFDSGQGPNDPPANDADPYYAVSNEDKALIGKVKDRLDELKEYNNLTEDNLEKATDYCEEVRKTRGPKTYMLILMATLETFFAKKFENTYDLMIKGAVGGPDSTYNDGPGQHPLTEAAIKHFTLLDNTIGLSNEALEKEVETLEKIFRIENIRHASAERSWKKGAEGHTTKAKVAKKTVAPAKKATPVTKKTTK